MGVVWNVLYWQKNNGIEPLLLYNLKWVLAEKTVKTHNSWPVLGEKCKVQCQEKNTLRWKEKYDVKYDQVKYKRKSSVQHEKKNTMSWKAQFDLKRKVQSTLKRKVQCQVQPGKYSEEVKSVKYRARKAQLRMKRKVQFKDDMDGKAYLEKMRRRAGILYLSLLRELE